MSEGDVVKNKEQSWFYTDIVKEHFFTPKNLLRGAEEAEAYAKKASGVGQVGSPACGDVMRMWLVIEDNKIKECKWQTFGCASAIASTSMLSVMLSENGGMEIEKALTLKPKDILLRLGGLPNRKIHCSVLGDQSLRAAIKDYQEKQGLKVTAEVSEIEDHH